MSSYDRIAEGYRKVYIRIQGISRLKLSELEEELKEKTAMLYMVDLREDKREVYAVN